MAPKPFVAALLGVALLLLAVIVVVIPASALGQCGEGSCGKIFASDCASSERCVSKWGGYYCVDDPDCSSAPSATGTPTAVTTTTATPAPSTTGSSCSSAGGVCRYWTGFYCYSGESDVGKKDCGSGQTCCKKAAVTPTPKVTPTKTPTTTSIVPTPAPSTGSSCSSAGGVCRYWNGFYCYSGESNVGKKDCGSNYICCKKCGGWCGAFSRSCESTETCVFTPIIGPIGSYRCVAHPACGAPTASNSTCGNGVCETGIGGETYSTCPQDCPKPVATSIPTSISKCSDGTPRFACSNSTPGKYCDGLGKLTTLARCSAPDTCVAAGGACEIADISSGLCGYSNKDIGKKDCGWGEKCCLKGKETDKTILKAQLNCGGRCGLTLGKCRQTEKCVAVSMAPGTDICSYEPRCAKLADFKTIVVNETFNVGMITNKQDMGDYTVAVSSVDTTTRRASIKVEGIYQVGTGRATQIKILGEGTSYTFYGSDIGGGITIKVNAVMGTSAELMVAYKG